MKKNLKWSKKHKIRNHYEYQGNRFCLDIDVAGQFDDEYVYWLEKQNKELISKNEELIQARDYHVSLCTENGLISKP